MIKKQFLFLLLLHNITLSLHCSNGRLPQYLPQENSGISFLAEAAEEALCNLEVENLNKNYCSICNKKTNDITTHNKEKHPLVCVPCNIQFYTMAARLSHLKFCPHNKQ